MSKCLERIQHGIIKENPTFVLMLGMCPTMAVTSSAINGLGMGLTTTVVLALSNVFISLLRKIIPDKARVPAFIVVVASFVTMVQFLLEAYLPSLNASLGIYIPLIVVNCIILGRAESFASKNDPIPSIFDGIGMGLGFTVALCSMAVIREVFGAASFAGIPITFMENYKIEFLTKAPGGLFVYGLMIALIYVVTHGKAPTKKSFSCEGCPQAAVCGAEGCTQKGAEN